MSYAKKDKVSSRQHPRFRQSCFMQVCQFANKSLPAKQAYVDISVFGWLRKQRPRFTGDKPKCCFHMKELERTTKAIARVNAGWRKLSALSSICQHVATCGNVAVFQMCRERQRWTGSLFSTKMIVPDLLTQGDEYSHECFR